MFNYIFLVFFLVLNAVLGKNIVSRSRENMFTLHFFIYLLIGLVVSDTFFLLSKYFGLPWWLCYVPVLAGVCISVIKKNIYVLAEKKHPAYQYLLFLAVYVIYILPVFIQGYRMSAGNYPQEFYNVDTPFYLGYTHALVQQNHFPVTSLEDKGFIFDVQYGPSGIAAMFTKVSGLLPHKSFTLVLPLCLLTIYFAATCKICMLFFTNAKGNRVLFLLAVLLILFGTQHYLFNYFKPYKIKSHLLGVQYYKANFPLMTALTGKTIAIVWLYSVLRLNKDAHWRMAVILLTGLMMLFKIAYSPSILAAFGCIALFSFWQTKKTVHLLNAVIAAGISFAIYKMFSPGATTYMSKTEVAWGFPGAYNTAYNYFYDEGVLLTILLFLTPVLVAFILLKLWRKAALINYIPALCVLPFALVCSVVYIINFNAVQLYSLLPAFAGIMFLGIFSKAVVEGNALAKKFMIGYIVLLIIPGLVSEAHYVKVLYTDKTKAHEYVNNQTLADVLGKVPVQNVVIATNDIRYPAENYARVSGQFALAAIYGQQFSGCNLAYIGPTPEMTAYRNNILNFLQLLQNSTWDSTALKNSMSFSRTGITHLLIHKTYLHSNAIPLPLLYQNQEYAVYRNTYP